MKKTTLTLSILFLSQLLCAQTPAIVAEDWVAKPVVHKIPAKYNTEPALVLKDVRRIEYIDVKKDVDQYYTLHKLIHINDDGGIEEFNKIYLGINENAEVVNVKARTILPGGKVLELNQSNIKEIKEKDGNVYKIFAMEGLEKGCEVEYSYTFKRPTSYIGGEMLQRELPVLDTKFELICPARLRFEVKPYNTDIAPTDTVLNGKRIIQCLLKETPGVDDEKYAAYNVNLKRVEFKLSYNDEGHQGERLFTWNDLAKRVYNIYSNYTDKENNQVQAIVKENGWDNLADEPSKIIAVESYVKKKYTYNDNLYDDASNSLANVVKNKIAGTNGIMRLYSSVFQNLGINYQYVLTCDKNKAIIDKSFENWNNCDNPLFYFPAENKYMAATRPDYRYPWVVPAWAGTNGLFCRKIALGNITSAVAEIRNIDLENYERSTNDIDTRLELNGGLDSLIIDTKQIYTGYAAIDMRDALNFSNEDGKRNIIKQMAKMVSNSENIISSEFINSGFEAATTNQPAILHIKTKSGELLERAGNKLLVKIGAVIGPQTEMYQEKPRQFPVNIDYGHIEERTINLMIPAGYSISNINDLKINKTYQDNGQLTMGFVSDYKLNGNMLTVHIMEQYRNTLYPLDQFEQFRRIINASADFNKVVLVLQKI